MSESNFVLFYQTFANVAVGAWNVLQSLTIAGVGLGSWFIGFAMLGVLVKIFFRITSVDASGGSSRDDE